MSNAELEDGGRLIAAPTSLVERLRGGAEFIENLCLQKAPADGFAATMREAADAIEELRRSEAVALANCADEHNRRLNLEQRYRWISVSERLPENGDHVLLSCKCGAGAYVCDGFHTEKYSMPTQFYEDIDADYDEETDEYYYPEGWWEVIKNWDDYSCVAIEDTATHWMPLPEPPEADERCSSLRDEEDGGRLIAAPTEEAENGEE